MKPGLIDVLASPGGIAPLRLEEARTDKYGDIVSGYLVNDTEGVRYPIENGIPNFLAVTETNVNQKSEGVSYAASDDPRAKWKNALRRFPKLTRLAQWTFDPAYVDHAERSRILRALPPDARVLNVGSGVLDVPGLDCVNLDVEAYGNVDVVADAQLLPFKDGSFDVVLLEYVVEHVPDSTRLKAEIERVLKAGGIIYATVPFMQAYHGNPDDYYRFTISGFRQFWSSFDCQRCAPFGGPASALVCMLKEWLAIMLSFNSKWLYGVLSQLLIIPFFPLKFLDRFIKTQNDHNIAFSIFYVGSKPGAPCIVDLYEPERAKRNNTALAMPGGLRGALLVGGIAQFWFLRGYYWSLTEEIIFSDMAMYQRMAENIIARFDFSYTPFYKNLMVPTMPTLRAIQMSLTGDSYLHWRIFQTLIVFAGLLWMVREIDILTRSRWVGLTALWVVALSKPSIFWSYKLSKESLAEGFTYILAASMLYALRQRSLASFFVLGVLQAIATLNRPNFALVAVFFAAAFAFTETRAQAADGLRTAFWRPARLLIVFAIGGLLVWAPWGWRSWNHLGTPFVLSTEAPWVFLAIAPLKVTLDDGRIVENKDELQKMLPTKFDSEREALPFLRDVVADWWDANRSKMPTIVWTNLKRTFLQDFIWLTRVSRTELLPPPANWLLVDKTPLALIGGLVGLVCLSILYQHGYLFLLLALVPSLSGAALAGIPRMLDPSLPLLLFGNVGWVLAVSRFGPVHEALSGLPRRVVWLALLPLALLPATLIPLARYQAPQVPPPVLANGELVRWSEGSRPVPSGWLFGGDGEGSLMKVATGYRDYPAARMINRSKTIGLYQDLVDIRGLRSRRIEISVWVKAERPGMFTLGPVLDGNQHLAPKNNVRGGEWERVVVQAQVPPGAISLRLHLWVTAPGVVEVSNVKMRF